MELLYLSVEQFGASQLKYLYEMYFVPQRKYYLFVTRTDGFYGNNLVDLYGTHR